MHLSFDRGDRGVVRRSLDPPGILVETRCTYRSIVVTGGVLCAFAKMALRPSIVVAVLCVFASCRITYGGSFIYIGLVLFGSGVYE